MDRRCWWLIGFSLFLLSGNGTLQSQVSQRTNPGSQLLSPVSFQQIDSLTYSHYLQENWKEVLKTADTGFSLGIDFYYLRMRAGIAAQELGRPVRAIKHFQRALDFNSGDKTASEYLQYSLIQSGNPEEARLYDHVGNTRLKSFFVEGGYMFTPMADEILSTDPEALISHHYFIRDYLYASAGLVVESGRRFGAIAATQTLQYQAVQKFLVQSLNPFEFELPFRQNSGYLSLYYYLGKGFTAQVSGQVLAAAYELKEFVETQTGGGYETTVDGYNDLALHAGLSAHFPYVTLTLGGDFNRFRGVPYIQGAGQITWFPLGSTALYLQSDLSAYQPVADTTSKPEKVFQLLAGFRLSDRIWMEGYATFGEMKNWSEKQAYVVYNNLDPIQSRMGLNLLFYNLFGRFDFSVWYIRTERITSWQLYDVINNEVEFTGEKDFTYPHQSIIGGITWRF